MKHFFKNRKKYLFSIVPLLALAVFFNLDKKSNSKSQIRNSESSNYQLSQDVANYFSLPCGFVSKGIVPSEPETFVANDQIPILQNPAGVVSPTIYSAPSVIYSDKNHNDELILQDDGNLVIYCITCNPVKALWSTNTNGKRGTGTSSPQRLYFQTDGNLVLHDINGNVIWNSGIHRTCSTGYAGQYTLQDDGNLVDQYDDPPGTDPHTTYTLGSSNSGGQSRSPYQAKIQ